MKIFATAKINLNYSLFIIHHSLFISSRCGVLTAGMEFHHSQRIYYLFYVFIKMPDTPKRNVGHLLFSNINTLNQEFKLLVDLSNDARTYGTATLTDSEAKTLLASDRSDKLNVHVYVVAGTAHLNVSGKSDDTGNVGSSEVELRSVTAEEGLGTATLLQRIQNSVRRQNYRRYRSHHPPRWR